MRLWKFPDLSSWRKGLWRQGPPQAARLVHPVTILKTVLLQNKARLPSALNGEEQGAQQRSQWAQGAQGRDSCWVHVLSKGSLGAPVTSLGWTTPSLRATAPFGKHDSPVLMCISLHFCGCLRRANRRMCLNFQESAISAESRFNSN